MLEEIAQGAAGVRLRHPRAAGPAGVPGDAEDQPDRHLRDRRGALHLPVGARLPPLLPAPARGHRGARQSPRPGPDRHRHSRRDRRHPPPARPRGDGGDRHRRLPREPPHGGDPGAARGGEARGPGRGCSARWRGRASSTSPRSRTARRSPSISRASASQAARYHGRLGARERKRTQDRFMAGDLRVIVATNAFGMGIDKPDIRFVVHYNLPGLAGVLLPGGRPRRPRRRAGPLRPPLPAGGQEHPGLLPQRPLPEAGPLPRRLPGAGEAARRTSTRSRPARSRSGPAGVAQAKVKVVLATMKDLEMVAETSPGRIPPPPRRPRRRGAGRDGGPLREAVRGRPRPPAPHGPLRPDGALPLEGDPRLLRREVEWDHCGHCDNCSKPDPRADHPAAGRGADPCAPPTAAEVLPLSSIVGDPAGPEAGRPGDPPHLRRRQGPLGGRRTA